MSTTTKLLRGSIRVLIRPNISPRMPVRLARAFLSVVGWTSPPVRGVRVESADCGGMHAERIDPDGEARNDVVILYLHGGAFRVCTARMYRGLTAKLSKATRATVVAPDYRRAPEHPYPAAHDDALAAARATLAAHPGARLVLAGDSAGGGLALATAQRLRDEGESRLAGVVLVSPWLDLTVSGESAVTCAAVDPMLSREGLVEAARQYLGAVDPASPAASPLFGALERLPPVHVEVGADEVLRDDSTRLEARARAAGVAIEVCVTEGMWHDFPLHAGQVPEADEAMGRMASFVDRVALG